MASESLSQFERSRQMMLTMRDLRLYQPKDDDYSDEASWGRLWKTLKLINSARDEQGKEATRHPNTVPD
jgi:hypothetical protein